MIYKFRSIFDRNNEYIIDSEEPLSLYDDFTLSINKVDSNSKSFAYENIDCELKYVKHGNIEAKYIELDKDNFNGYYMMIENFKHKQCLKMNIPIEIIKEEQTFEYKDVTLLNGDEEMKIAFNKYIQENSIMDMLFQCFLHGVSYGKLKKT